MYRDCPKLHGLHREHVVKTVDPVKHWLSSAREELRASRTLFGGGHWRHVIFLCHLSVEKSIKAAVQKRTGRVPPKTHDLVLLLRQAEVEPPEELRAFIGQLSGLSIPTRYPDVLRVTAGGFDRKFAAHCLRMASRVHRWFEQAVR